MCCMWGYAQDRRVCFRGGSTGERVHSVDELTKNARINLALHARAQNEEALRRGQAVVWDVGIINTVQMENPEVVQALQNKSIVLPEMNIPRMMHARGLFDVDGNSNSWDGSWWKLRSNSVVLKLMSQNSFRQWYYSRLEPWEHYVPVRHDLKDVNSAVAYVLDDRNRESLQRMAGESPGTFVTRRCHSHRVNHRTIVQSAEEHHIQLGSRSDAPSSG